MWKKTLMLILGTFSAVGMLITPALGIEYPAKPIEILCPFTPGSPADMLCRIIADIAPKYLNQPMIVTNKPGAGGSIAAADIISSKPDGYKLVMTTNMFFATTVKTQKIPFDPNDLIPIANFFEYRCVVAVKDDSPWKTFNDLLDYARKNPGKLRWTSSGRGMVPHLNGLLIFRKAGVETIYIAYKASPEQIAALLGGHTDAYVGPYGSVMDHVRAGKIRVLVLVSDRRYSEPSGIPTAAEIGFPETAKMITYMGLYAHKDTPEEIKKTLIGACKKIYENPKIKKGIEAIGGEPTFGGPEFIKETIERGEEVGVPILKELGLYVGK